MTPSLALCVFGLFLLWLFAKERKLRKNVSFALWIPLSWAFIVGSKPVSLWLGINPNLGSTEYVEDSILDKVIFAVLIASGLVVLMKRRANWSAIFLHNQWLFAYFLYLGISTLWADDSFVAFKRWIKDIGNVVMVLVVLSEEDPLGAIRAFLAKCTYLFVPLSVLVTKYYPGISIQYGKWDGRAFYVAITTNKNILGMTLFVCGLSLFWLLLDQYDKQRRTKDKAVLLGYSILILMTAWLLIKARSSTAFTCLALGGGILLGMRVPAIRGQVNRLGAYTAGVAALLVFLQASGLWGVLVTASTRAVGRDPTLHGRAEIWQAVSKEDINPLFGAGFYSFWTTERMQRLSAGYHYLLNEAHNGYFDIYLSSGLIGLAALIGMLVAAAGRIKRALLDGSVFGSLRLAILTTTIVYNVTESIFDRLGLVWFALLLVVTEYPRLVKARATLSTRRPTEATSAVFADQVPSPNHANQANQRSIAPNC